MDKPIRTLLGMVQHRTQRQRVPKTAEEWYAHWQSQGQPWRTEPEIDGKRQKELNQRRAIIPDIKQGIYPFKGMKLSRADVEWLLATHEHGRGPVDWNDERQQWEREGVDLRGADLCQANLDNLPLTCVLGGLTENQWLNATEAQRVTAAVQMEKTSLRGTHLENAVLCGALFRSAELPWADLGNADLSYAHLENAYLERANLKEVFLEGAWLKEVDLSWACLEDGILRRAHLENATLVGANLKNANLLEAHLTRANLRGAYLEGALLEDVILADEHRIGPLLADVRWSGVNLGMVKWSRVKMLTDEYEARQGKSNYGPPWVTLPELYEQAARANRQLALALQDQGMNEEAARFAYRAQILQRKVFWKQRAFGKWLFSMLLALVAGYGYRMWRILVAYLLIVLLCAGAYFVLSIYYEPHLSFLEAVLTSITAFHGRVFSEPFLRPDEPQLWVTAFEAVAGLVIEGVFIAMLTQRFFGK